jgi:DNA-binding CsgD family transcriptional regulator
MSANAEALGVTTVAVFDDAALHDRSQIDFNASLGEPGGREHFQRLEAILGEVMRMVRLRACGTDAGDGVLLDAIVGDVRCLCIQRGPNRLISLSPRQQQIAAMVAAGCTNHAIASCLSISVWTVSTHLRRIFTKLSVSSRSEMVAHLLANPDFSKVTENKGL